jgi:16S rRNA (guanine966-N2)-methyltransferase
VREAVFSTLISIVELDGAVVLDLYAGSGALAFEALSRGALRAALVERDPVLVKKLRENSSELGLAENSKIVSTAVEKSFSQLGKLGESFDIIFADPPYEVDVLAIVAENMLKYSLAIPGSLLVYESASDAAPLVPQTLELVKSKCYGDTEVGYFRFLAEKY